MLESDQSRLAQARRATFEIYRREASSTWVQARGRSMLPLIRPGDWMLVDFGALPAGAGAIVLFPLGDLIVAHRVVASQEQGGALLLRTKGDAEPYFDPALTPADVLGVVRGLRRSPVGPVRRIGCVGRAARMIARFSRLHGRGVAFTQRRASALPPLLRRPALCALPLLARAAALLALAPLGMALWSPFGQPRD